MTNPKGYLFFSAFLPQFLDPSAPLAPQYVALAVTFALLDGVVMFGYALLGARAVRLLKRAGRCGSSAPAARCCSRSPGRWRCIGVMPHRRGCR